MESIVKRVENESTKKLKDMMIDDFESNEPKQVKQKGKSAKAMEKESWFKMETAKMTPELRRDLQLLKMRDILDPKHTTRKLKSPIVGGEFQVGTIVEPAQDFYSSRLTKSQRKRTFAEEILADSAVKQNIKKRFSKIKKAQFKKKHMPKAAKERKERKDKQWRKRTVAT